jgi:hypothetical protein
VKRNLTSKNLSRFNLSRVATIAVSIFLVALVGAECSVSPKTVDSSSRCKRVSFTGDGGYYSAAHFYPEPAEQVTVVTDWCFSHGSITSHQVNTTTSIPKAQHLYLHKSAQLSHGGQILNISINGNFSSNVLSHGGIISIEGSVTSSGHHQFADVTGSEG